MVFPRRFVRDQSGMQLYPPCVCRLCVDKELPRFSSDRRKRAFVAYAHPVVLHVLEHLSANQLQDIRISVNDVVCRLEGLRFKNVTTAIKHVLDAHNDVVELNALDSILEEMGVLKIFNDSLSIVLGDQAWQLQVCTLFDHIVIIIIYYIYNFDEDSTCREINIKQESNNVRSELDSQLPVNPQETSTTTEELAATLDKIAGVKIPSKKRSVSKRTMSKKLKEIKSESSRITPQQRNKALPLKNVIQGSKTVAAAVAAALGASSAATIRKVSQQPSLMQGTGEKMSSVVSKVHIGNVSAPTVPPASGNVPDGFEEEDDEESDLALGIIVKKPRTVAIPPTTSERRSRNRTRSSTNKKKTTIADLLAEIKSFSHKQIRHGESICLYSCRPLTVFQDSKNKKKTTVGSVPFENQKTSPFLSPSSCQTRPIETCSIIVIQNSCLSERDIFLSIFQGFLEPRLCLSALKSRGFASALNSRLSFGRGVGYFWTLLKRLALRC
uniref:DUF5745 domain-containing protein n=1 Tax=Heterorhabditis bacteriophora TaxID=37862 RepID=A0A1I7WT46_HETBA